jgi:hypothetical protein
MSDTTQKREKCMSTIIRISVLSWSAALLTASYAGLLAKMDPTFIATVFTAAAATFGVDTLKKGDKDEDEKKELPRTEFVVEPTPGPVLEAPASSGLEQRVGALEAKVEGDEGEGFVQPRTVV